MSAEFDPASLLLDNDDEEYPHEETDIILLDELLCCHICSELFTAPNILPCLHSYCSSCIRRWLDKNSTNGCPKCRASVTKSQLLVNSDLRDIVSAYRKVKPRLVALLRGAVAGGNLEGSHAVNTKVNTYNDWNDSGSTFTTTSRSKSRKVEAPLSDVEAYV